MSVRDNHIFAGFSRLLSADKSRAKLISVLALDLVILFIEAVVIHPEAAVFVDLDLPVSRDKLGFCKRLRVLVGENDESRQNYDNEYR